MLPRAGGPALLDEIPDAVLVVGTDGRVQAANARARALFGGEVAGAPAADLAAEAEREGHPLRLPDGDEPLEAVFTARRTDGSLFRAEACVGRALRDGAPAAIATLRAWSAGRRDAELFRGLLALAPDAALATDRRGRIVLANALAERMFGYEKGALAGCLIEDLVPERYRGLHERHREDYGRAPRVRPMGAAGLQLVGRRRDGSEFPVEISLGPVETAAGLLVIAVVRDTSERTRREAERAALERDREAVRLREEMLSVMSHEIRTPLNALVLRVETLLRQLQAAGGLDERLARQLEGIQRARRRVVSLLELSLDATRLGGGHVTLERRPLELGQVVRDAAALLADDLDRVGMDLRAPAPVPVEGDPARLEQVFVNLLSNALKYGEDRPVEVTVAREGDRARVSVRDHGRGLAPDERERVFERFVRAKGVERASGFGLGLWIVRQLVQAHGGSVRADGAPERGAVFVVELPLAAPARG